MIRRSLRISLRLGLLAGIAFAVFKIMQSRRAVELPPPSPRDPWPPVPAPTPEPAAVEEAVAIKASPAAAPAKKAPAKKAVKAAKKSAKAAKKSTKKAAGPWVEPQSGVCPLSHPIKAKMASMIFHVPGMANYTRTRPDRCYATEAAAKRDGFAPAKR